MQLSATWAAAMLAVLGVAAGSWAADAVARADPDAPQDDSPHIRATLAAIAVARTARSLADTASARTRAALSAEAMAASRASIDADAAEASQQLDVLASADHEDAAARLRELLDVLVRDARQIEAGRGQFAESLRDSERSREELIAATSWQLLPAALASEDDLFHRILSDPDASESRPPGTTDAVSVEDLLLYARLALLTQQIDQGHIALEVATRQTDSEFIGTVEEAANLVMYQLRESLESFAQADHDDLDPALVPLARDLVEAAYGEKNLIDLMKTRLRLDETEARLVNAVDAVASTLQIEVDAVLEQIVGDFERTSADGSTARGLQAVMAASQHASAVASHLSGPTTADTSLAALPEIGDAVAGHISGMRQGLDTLADAGHGTAVAHLYAEIDRLGSIAERILAGRPELASALQSAARERAQLRSFVDYQLEPAVVASLDNQLYYMLTGRSEFRDSNAVASDRLSHVEFMRYWHLSSVYSSLFRTFSGLIIAIIMTEPTLIGEGEERFTTASHRLEKSIDFLEAAGGAEVDPQLIPLARQFIALGAGESSVFDSLRHRLPLIAAEKALMEDARQVHARFQDDMDAALDGILRDAASSAEQ